MKRFLVSWYFNMKFSMYNVQMLKAILWKSSALNVYIHKPVDFCKSIVRMTMTESPKDLRYAFTKRFVCFHKAILCALNPVSSKPNGDKGIRTLDPLLARQVLSQLSYTPIPRIIHLRMKMGLNGLEPSTSRLSGVRSNQLSYKPISIWQPPTFPCRLQHSIIGRLGLNHRVRDENGCVP